MEQLLTDFPDVIREGVGRFSGWTVGIDDVQGQLHSVPTKVPYAFAAEVAACKKEIDQLIDAGIVERFHGKPKHIIPWFSVAKKDSVERRVVLDFRGLNTLTARRPALPMHREGAVQGLSGMCVFAKFDFRHGFYQIPMAEELRPYFVTIFDRQPYAFTRLPMGWINSMAFFDQAVQQTIAEARDCLRKRGVEATIESYADDVCVGAKTADALNTAARELMRVYRKYGWTTSPKKCKCGVEEIEFLGYNFSKHGVLPPKATVQQLLNATPPRTKTEVRSFLGLLRTLLRYHRIDVRSLSALQQLSHLEAKTIQQYWKEDPARWKNIIRSLDRMWYNRPDAAGGFVELYVDASRDGFGYALFDQKSKRLIQMGAGGFRRERFQSSGKAELLGLEKALREVRHLIIGKRVTIFSDATVVKQASGTKDQSFLVQRHLDTLNLAAGRVKHVDGVANVIADLLSRSPWWRSTLASQEATALGIKTTTQDNHWPDWYLRMEDYLRTKRCPEEATPQQRAQLKHRSKYFRIRDNQLEYSADGLQWTPCCMDPQAVPEWLDRAHEQSGHYGIHTTTQQLQRMIYFPNAPSRVRSWVRSCPQCQRFARHDPPVTQSFNTWQHMNQCIGLDVIGPMKPDGTQRFILAAVDLCTRFCLLTASSQANAATIIRLLERWTALFGNPESIQTDNAPAFVGNQLSHWMSDRGIRRRTIPAYRPQCNGAVERLNQEVIRRLQRLQTQGKWAGLLPQVQALLNSHPNAVTNLSAAQTAFGYQPRLHSLPNSTATGADTTSATPHSDRHRETLAARWTAVDAQMQYQQNQRRTQSHRDIPLPVGSLVLLFDHQHAHTHGNKLAPQWLGPYQIHNIFSPQLLSLTSDSSKHPFLAHRDHIRPFFRRSFAQGSDCRGEGHEGQRAARSIDGNRNDVNHDVKHDEIITSCSDIKPGAEGENAYP